MSDRAHARLERRQQARVLRHEGTSAGARPRAARNTDEVADVDVWNTTDERIQSVQMIRADADRNFTFREAFDVTAGKFVKLADQTMRDLDVAPDGRWAVGRDTRGTSPTTSARPRISIASTRQPASAR